MSAVGQHMKGIKARADIPSFLKRHALNRRIVEVGVRFGYHLEALRAADPDLLIGVDHYRESANPAQQDTGMKQDRLDGLHKDVFSRFLHCSEVRIFRGTSREAAMMLSIYTFDFVYLDADHSFEGAMEDINLWWARVRQGGILAGHDYIEESSRTGVKFGVVKAVQQFLKEQEVKYFHHTEDGYRTWMALKLDGE